MPEVCDSTLDFDPGDPYVFDPEDVELDGDGARLAGTGVGVGTIETPDVDTSEFTDRILRASVTADESPGYIHRIMMSDDGGDNWRYHTAAGWFRGDATNIFLQGNPLNYFRKIKEWPDPTVTGTMRFLIYMERAVENAEGNISQIALCYGSEVLDFSRPDGALEPLPIQPDFPVKAEFIEQNKRVTTENGQIIAWPLSTKLRRIYKLRWSSLSAGQKNTMEQFLRAHVTRSFTWTPPDSGTQKRLMLLGEPEVENVFASAWWNMSAEVIEKFAGEG